MDHHRVDIGSTLRPTPYTRDRKLLFGVIEWKSWKLTRKCRSSLAAESQAMADSADMLDCVRLFFADCLHPVGIDLRRPDAVLKLLPQSCAIPDCKSLYDALEKNASLGLRSLREANFN